MLLSRDPRMMGCYHPGPSGKGSFTLEDSQTPILDDAAYLQTLGVHSQLHRSLNFVQQGLFGVAFQGPTAGSILVTSVAFAVGGPAFIWVFPVAFVLQMVLALLWSELVSQYPLTGGIYQWSKYLGGEWWGWLSAVMYLGCTVIIQPVLGVIVNVILNGLFPSFAFNIHNSLWIAATLTVISGLVLTMDVRIAALINSVGVFFELAVLFGATILLFFHTRQPVSVVFHTAGVQGHGSYIIPFCVALVLELTLLTGFEAAGFFSEEVRHSQTGGPKGILSACSSTCVFAGLFAFAMLLATPNIHAGMAAGPEWVPQVLHAALGRFGENAILVGALVALISTEIATMASTSRLLYGLSRDGFLPGSSKLAKVSKRSGEPLNVVILAVLLSMIPLIIINNVMVVVDAIAALEFATYLVAAGLLLKRRLGGWPTRPAPFRLGKFGTPLTFVGLAWIIFTLLMLLWPRVTPNPVLGPTRVVWEVFVILIALGVAGWGYYVWHLRSAAPRQVEDSTMVL